MMGKPYKPGRGDLEAQVGFLDEPVAFAPAGATTGYRSITISRIGRQWTLVLWAHDGHLHMTKREFDPRRVVGVIEDFLGTIDVMEVEPRFPVADRDDDDNDCGGYGGGYGGGDDEDDDEDDDDAEA